MKLLNFTIIKLTFCLIVGIVIGYLTNLSLNAILYTTYALLGILFLFFLIAKNQFTKTVWFGISSFILMIFIGVLTTNFHNQKNFSNHYTKHISKEKDVSKTIRYRIREVLKPSNYYNKYVIDILNIENNNVTGKSLLNIQKDTTRLPLKVDAVFISKVNFKDLTHPLNPHQFNYKGYLEKKYIYHQIFISNKSLLKVNNQTHTLLGVANNTRDYINSKLKLYHFKRDELAIINALLLGQRQDISEEIYSSYTDAGAIHILAVSGLHVGIILLILSFILKPLENFKHGKLTKTILLVILLWCFALIAGLSASVTRAVTMFSIVAIAINLKRPTNIYNTLAISILIILLLKPMFLFDIGFQLSYLAVFSIVIIDPFLFKLWHPKNKLLTFYWHTFTVTVSAQFGIIPLSLYYFHQFPSLFFISNLVIIPILGIILGFGILVISLALLNVLPQFIANIYGSIISYMNDFVSWVSKQESFLFKDIPYSLLQVLISYLLSIIFIKLLKKWCFYNLKLFLITIVFFQCAIIYTNYNKPKNKFIVFHKSRYSLIGNTTKNKITISNNFDSLVLKNNIIKDYSIRNHINTVEKDSFKSIYLLNKTTFFVIDSLGIYNVKSFTPDYVLLRQSPKINLNRLIDSIKPQCIIADGSNYKSYIKSWKVICKKRKLHFHQTGKNGALIIDY